LIKSLTIFEKWYYAEIDWEEQRITIYGKGRRDEGEEIDEARSRFGGDSGLVNGSP
jgi:hypothetical protein